MARTKTGRVVLWLVSWHALQPVLPFGCIDTEEENQTQKPRSRTKYQSPKQSSVHHRVIGEDESTKKTPPKKEDEDLSSVS